MITKNEEKSEDNQSFYHTENGLPAKLKQYIYGCFYFCYVEALSRKERKIYFHQDVHELCFLLWPNFRVLLCIS